MELIEIVQHHDNEALKRLIATRININDVDDKGRTALWWAADMNEYKCATILIDAKADVNKADNNGETPLHMAFFFGSVECIQILIQHKANVNALNTYGNSPLHLASMNGSLACVQTLADFITEMDGLRNYRGHTPLACALSCNHLNIAEFLLHSGAKMKNVSQKIKVPDLMHKIVAKRNTAMYSTLVVKGLLKRRLGLSKDVTNLLGFYFWNLRLHIQKVVVKK